LIESINLTKKYGNVTALENVSFTAERGVLGVCGARGAGKSSLLAIIAGALPYSSGELTVNGDDPAPNSCGYLMEENPMFKDMSVSEFLVFIGESKKIQYEKLYRQIKEVIDLCELDEIKDMPISAIKTGDKKMVGIASSLLGNPKLIVLDEPFAGMTRRELSTAKAIIKMLGDIKTVVISSSFPTDISDVCSDIILLSSGKLVACDSVENLNAAVNDICAFELKLTKNIENTLSALLSLDGVSECIVLPDSTKTSSHVKVVCDESINIKETILDTLKANEADVFDISTTKITLDDLCVSLDNAQEDK
jgi:ABC-2 type transport system ATP-binding protein